MLMFVVSNIVGSTIQITTLPLPVLSTLQASGLVFNTIFATLILGEPFTRYSLFGTILVCMGAVLIATFGAIGEPAHTLDQLLELLKRRPFILWMAGTVVIVLVILSVSRALRSLSSPYLRLKPRPLRLLSPLQAPYTPKGQARVRLFCGMCFGLVSGILSAHSLLLAKSAVELVVRTVVDRVNQFNRWQSWVILLGMIVLALTQLFYLHRGLKLCSTSVLYPFVFCIYNIIAILDGLIYFRQVGQLSAMHAGLIALGTIILLSGVLCLSWRLEDIDSHAGVTATAPSQTGLGPGIGGVMDEHLHHHPPSPDRMTNRTLDLESAEAARLLGEYEPLLERRRRSHERTPSLPSSASIWAELDDDDDDGDDEAEAEDEDNLYRSDSSRFKSAPAYRPRSKSSPFFPPRLLAGRRSLRSSQTWGSRSRRVPNWRRTSLPISTASTASPPPRRSLLASSSTTISYGAISTEHRPRRHDTASPRSQPIPTTPPTTSPRSNLFRRGLWYFQRWMGGGPYNQ
ncbi:hypothetical protein ASPZODRAFT_136689 [Penicilliopsis zonata CBS 506.65]|uniref:Uncharacterized protein n=1 Tax=Penicilliopsis zonata CBS 506.65 TaxID=1073090 RepID=A0A1L9S7I5_9EURO|nr:hypothetical protein ASPZODRAFT_136689 [Penicilliopsis zonata CBS 506.65]OJJ43137.1 hypothetical protein ASPZODRAFT_136689 [Penicilliopsis zonata CBS 506.65]